MVEAEKKVFEGNHRRSLNNEYNVMLFLEFLFVSGTEGQYVQLKKCTFFRFFFSLRGPYDPSNCSD